MLGFFHPERESEISLGGLSAHPAVAGGRWLLHSVKDHVNVPISGSLFCSWQDSLTVTGSTWMQAVRILFLIVPMPKRSWRMVSSPRLCPGPSAYRMGVGCDYWNGCKVLGLLQEERREKLTCSHCKELTQIQESRGRHGIWAGVYEVTWSCHLKQTLLRPNPG